MHSAPIPSKSANLGSSSLRRQALPVVAVSGAGVYVTVLVALPLLDSGFDVLTTHPEDYARGTFGIAVNASYLALAIALVCLVLALLPVRRWAIAVPILLVPAAVLCGALAVNPIAVAGGSAWLLVPVFGLALGPLVGSLSLRERFHPWEGAIVGVGLAVVIAFAGVLVAPDSVGGAVNRAFDVLVGLWIIVAALAVHRLAAPPRASMA